MLTGNYGFSHGALTTRLPSYLTRWADRLYVDDTRGRRHGPTRADRTAGHDDQSCRASCLGLYVTIRVHGHTMRKQGNCREKEIMQGTMPGARRRGRPRTSWIDNIKSWTGLSVEESIRMTEDRDKWRKYVHGVANRRIEDG